MQKFDVKLARAHNQIVRNHSNKHKQLTLLSASGTKKEMSVKGLKTNCARPPYGAVNNTVRSVFKQIGMSVDLWTVDTNDWRGPKSQSTITNYVIKTSRPGDVVLMHMQHNAFNSTALKTMKTGLNKRGIVVYRK